MEQIIAVGVTKFLCDCKFPFNAYCNKSADLKSFKEYFSLLETYASYNKVESNKD